MIGVPAGDSGRNTRLYLIDSTCGCGSTRWRHHHSPQFRAFLLLLLPDILGVGRLKVSGIWCELKFKRQLQDLRSISEYD